MLHLRKAENATTANHANLVSPSQGDRPAPLSIKPLKLKLPMGVLPIPKIFEQNIEENMNDDKQEDVRKRDNVAARNPPALPRFALVNAVNSKEEKEEVIEAGNLNPLLVANPPAAGHRDEQIADKRANNGAWFGVQEIGEINQLGRIPEWTSFFKIRWYSKHPYNA